MSNTQKKNVPELRFPGFEGEWEEKKLGDTLELVKDGTHGTHESVSNGPWLLSAKNIKNNKIIISSDDRKISENDYQKIYKNYKLEKGDLLLTIVGTIGRTTIVKDPRNIAFQRSVAILKTKTIYDVGFIFQLFQTNYFKNLLLRKQVVSAQPGIYLGDIRKLKISITNIIEEQQKIGKFLSKLDRQIELEEQKLELLQQQKKGYMQKIFSQELRFKDENGNGYPEWEEKKLGEIACKVIKKNTDKIYTETLTNSAELGIISQRDFFDKEISNIDNIKNYYVVEENDFVYNPRISTYAPFGPVNRNKLGKKGVMSPLYTVFRIQNIDLNFIEFYFKSSKWYRFMALNGDSGARADRFSIKDKTFMEMPFYIPCMDEQIKIGQFFNNIDKCIKNYQNKINFLKKNKESFLQKMFI
ncbi:restriction endonuclease subunit S [Staphylococcus schweitzeri]|uniref:Type I restriction modification DNA specificity protein n=1 Tax=Staphylococcus schweitzeri TaxID=1654388 RepID=A0A077ULN9_9STAP|nr:restriction endonuclease subunit S [Staphylococcus schweitzeri]CDR29281.1 type I restriction modification DNA specificity protein [Staphylococcus schweitzeri]